MAQDAGRERQDCGARMPPSHFTAEIDGHRAAAPRDRARHGRKTDPNARRGAVVLQPIEHWGVAAEWPSATRVDARAPLVADRARARDRGIGSLETLDECARIPSGRAHRGVLFEAPQKAIGAFILAQRTGRFEDARRADKCLVFALESAVLQIPKLAGADIDGSRAGGPQQLNRFARGAVNELRAELRGDQRPRGGARQDPAADAIARLDQQYA